MHFEVLINVVLVLGLAIGILMITSQLKIPSMVGFLVTGVVIGPHGFNVIRSVDDIELLAELGVVLLLFTVGIEFPFRQLWKIKRVALLGGFFQMAFTMLLLAVISLPWVADFRSGIFLGILGALSSTAIVLKLLSERAEIEAPHGRIGSAILIFQDIAVIPLMMFLPLLAGQYAEGLLPVLKVFAEAVVVVTLVILAAKWIMPRMLHFIASTRNHELFFLALIALCFATAALDWYIGLSLAMGAFLAGLILSESEYSHDALGKILPFRDLFLSIFFISIGMLLDLSYFISDIHLVILTTIIIIAAKAFIVWLVVLLLGYPLRVAVIGALSIAQIGEFSFVLSSIGKSLGLISDELYQLFLAVSFLTMFLTPLLMRFAPKLAEVMSKRPWFSSLNKVKPHEAEETQVEFLSNHLIIVGYGMNGRHLSLSARTFGIPYIIIEMNPETVRREREHGFPIFYGDASNEVVLQTAGIKGAKICAIAISEAEPLRRIVRAVKQMNPACHLIVRTRFLPEVEPLLKLGADEVIPEEFETSVEILSRMLNQYLIPQDDIEKFVLEVRAGGYAMLRSLPLASNQRIKAGAIVPGAEILSLRVGKHSPLAGKMLAETDLRTAYGATVLAIRKQKQTLPNPDGKARLDIGDITVVLCSPAMCNQLTALFRGS